MVATAEAETVEAVKAASATRAVVVVKVAAEVTGAKEAAGPAAPAGREESDRHARKRSCGRRDTCTHIVAGHGTPRHPGRRRGARRACCNGPSWWLWSYTGKNMGEAVVPEAGVVVAMGVVEEGCGVAARETTGWQEATGVVSPQERLVAMVAGMPRLALLLRSGQTSTRTA